MRLCLRDMARTSDDCWVSAAAANLPATDIVIYGGTLVEKTLLASKLEGCRAAVDWTTIAVPDESVLACPVHDLPRLGHVADVLDARVGWRVRLIPGVELQIAADSRTVEREERPINAHIAP